MIIVDHFLLCRGYLERKEEREREREREEGDKQGKTKQEKRYISYRQQTKLSRDA